MTHKLILLLIILLSSSYPTWVFIYIYTHQLRLMLYDTFNIFSQECITLALYTLDLTHFQKAYQCVCVSVCVCVRAILEYKWETCCIRVYICYIKMCAILGCMLY